MSKKESIANKESTTSGFENIGKFYKHYRTKSKDINKDKVILKPIHQQVYMLLTEYSFGYMKNIQTEISMPIAQIMNECYVSNKTAIDAMHVLLESGLVKRVKWQHVGPKQVYKYKVVFPKGYNIDTKQIEDENDIMEHKLQKSNEVL